MNSFDFSRRGFLQLGTLSLSGASGGTFDLQGQTTASEGFQQAVFLLGPRSARPAPDGPFFADKTYYQYLYEDLSGARWTISQDDSDWQPITRVNRQWVHEESDLPDPTNETHTLEDDTVYSPVGFVTHQYPIELATTSPLVGSHGGTDGFIYTGAGSGRGAALQGTDANFLARDCYMHAPGATLFDLSANQSTEMLVESCAFSDAAGLGQIASLGTINGYRVPSFKGCNFEDFASGLTFDGTPDKIFISGCPMRGVTASGVTILTFAGTLDVDIVDMPDNYVKGVQSDTEVIRVESGGSPTDVFQYRGTTHDSSVTVSNILTGEAGEGAVGYRIDNAYPLRDSSVVGELSLDSQTTTTISAQDTYTQIEGATSLGNESVRVTQTSDGVLRYDGKKNTDVKITASVTAEAPSNETFAVAVAKNGTVEPTSEVRGEGTGNSPVFVAPSGVEDLSTGDTLSLHIKNMDSSGDITVDLYNMNFSGL